MRNLASRSAEAANEIKSLVESATLKANDGKKIANTMISGYGKLNENISKTSDLIRNVSEASKEQLLGIEQINAAVNELDKNTQHNATIASEANNITNEISIIANTVLDNANAKEFDGKDSVSAKKLNINVVKTEVKPDPVKVESPRPTSTTTPVSKPASKPISREIKANTSDDDEWESF